MDIQHIRYFLEIARQQSFSRAAARLFVTQPILTRCVKQLEEELGTSLILRTTKSFALTEAGHSLVRDGNLLLQQYQDIFRHIQDIRELKTGEVNISSPGVLLDMYFPKLVTQYRAQYPGIRISIRESGSRPIVQEVLEGTADIGIVMLPLQEDDKLKIFPIVRDRVHVFVREDHPFAREASVDIAQLQGEAIITYNRSTTLYNAFLQRCQEQDFVPHVAYQSMMPNFILDTIAFGSCVGILPGPMLQLCHSQKLVSVPLAPDFPWEIALITRKDRYLSFAAANFLEFAQAYFA